MNADNAKVIREIVALISAATQPCVLPGLGGMTKSQADELESLLFDLAEGIKHEAIEP